jgi:hypothetical protein
MIIANRKSEDGYNCNLWKRNSPQGRLKAQQDLETQKKRKDVEPLL